jgi:hypothetical protein
VAAIAARIARITMFELNLTAMNETTDHVGGANAGITFKTKTTRKITRKTNTVCNRSCIFSKPYRNTITTPVGPA